MLWHVKWCCLNSQCILYFLSTNYELVIAADFITSLQAKQQAEEEHQGALSGLQVVIISDCDTFMNNSPNKHQQTFWLGKTEGAGEEV